MPFATEALDSILVLARMRGVAPMVRVAWNDPALIKKAYDAGAVAVMVPQVDTAAEAAAAVEAARYAPEGRRGLSPMWTQIAGADWDEVIKTANEGNARRPPARKPTGLRQLGRNQARTRH